LVAGGWLGVGNAETFGYLPRLTLTHHQQLRRPERHGLSVQFHQLVDHLLQSRLEAAEVGQEQLA
jgi:hypothetical protein